MGVRELEYYLDDSGDYAGGHQWRQGVPAERPFATSLTVVPPVRRAARPINDRRPASGLAPSRPVARSVRCAEPVPVSQGYRMGRWARLATTVTVLLAGLAIALSVSTGTTVGRTEQMTVNPGDSLRSVAAAVAGDRDVTDVMQQIRELNGSVLSDLVAGSVILVPVSG